MMKTTTSPLLFLVIFGLLLSGCDILEGVSAEPLRLTSQDSEPGWNHAVSTEGVSADCPASWTLEVTRRTTRAWRCSHPAAQDAPGGCGLTVYKSGGAQNLDELATKMLPQIESYGEESEVISNERTTLGSHEAQAIILDQTIDEVPVRGWYRMSLIDDTAWLAHCILPEDHVENDQETVVEILDRIEL